MRILELPTGWTIVIDILVWLAIHLGASYLMTLRPAHHFNPAGWLFRQRKWEGKGWIYEAIFMIKGWKSLLPDGAAFFKAGFRKKAMEGRNEEYVVRFVRETCRGELTHWIVLICGPFFLFWNTPLVGMIMILYAMAANFPCIITQRYNRIRLGRVLNKLGDGGSKNSRSR